MPGSFSFPFQSKVLLPLEFTDAPDAIASGNTGPDGFSGVQYPWSSRRRPVASKTLAVSPFYADEQLVTNRQFSAYLSQSRFLPNCTRNWLAHWDRSDVTAVHLRGGSHAQGSTAPAPSKEILDRPVVWVSRGDADAFCRF